MAEFLEERFPTDINYGSGFESSSANQTVRTAGGNEYRSLRHPYVMAKLQVDFSRQRDEVIERIIDLNYRANGMFRGFRVYHNLDHSTNNYRDVPAPFDQEMSLISAGHYQLMRWYGEPSDVKASRRRIRKPVAGSVSIGVGGVQYPQSQWTVDNATGIVTMSANKGRSITSISNASSAVIGVGLNTFQVGETVVFIGVSGMTPINMMRGVITYIPSITEITVNIDTTSFPAYISGGSVQTEPQSFESVTCGCYFDIPMRFDADLGGTFVGPGVLGVTGIGLTEILNP